MPGQETSVCVLMLDLDGTILSSRGVLEPRTAAAIRKASEAGIQIVFASARPLWSIRELTAVVSPAHYIAAGGAVVADPAGVILARWWLTTNDLHSVTEILDQRGVPALLYRDDLTMRHGDSAAIRAEALLTAKDQRLPTWDDGPADKLLGITDGDPVSLVGELERVPVAATTSHGTHVEVTAPGVNKAQASEVILQRLRADWRGVMAIGDGDNDVCLLEQARYALTVEGASASARQAADRIIGTNDDGSVARHLESIYVNRGGSREPAPDDNTN